VSENNGFPGQFAFYLPSNTDESGELFLGGYDDTKFTGSLHYVPVSYEACMRFMTFFVDIYVFFIFFYFCVSDWQINLDGAKVNGKSLQVDQAAIVDTGTSFIYGPNTYDFAYFIQVVCLILDVSVPFCVMFNIFVFEILVSFLVFSCFL